MDQVKRGAGVALLGLVLLLVGALSGRDEDAGALMFSIGALVLFASLVGIAIVLIRGEKPKHANRD